MKDSMCRSLESRNNEPKEPDGIPLSMLQTDLLFRGQIISVEMKCPKCKKNRHLEVERRERHIFRASRKPGLTGDAPLFSAFFVGGIILEGWGKVKPSAKYAGVSERTFRDFLKMGLEHSRLPSGTILVHQDSIDQFLRKFTVSENTSERIANEVLRGIQ